MSGHQRRIALLRSQTIHEQGFDHEQRWLGVSRVVEIVETAAADDVAGGVEGEATGAGSAEVTVERDVIMGSWLRLDL